MHSFNDFLLFSKILKISHPFYSNSIKNQTFPFITFLLNPQSICFNQDSKFFYSKPSFISNPPLLIASPFFSIRCTNSIYPLLKKNLGGSHSNSLTFLLEYSKLSYLLYFSNEFLPLYSLNFNHLIQISVKFSPHLILSFCLKSKNRKKKYFYISLKH